MADNDNTGLALIVGGLVVAAAIFGFAVWGPSGTGLGNIQPAAGPAYTTSTTTHEKNTVITPPSETGDQGSISTTTTRTKTETQNP